MRVFGMITTLHSWEYTSYALKSFFRFTACGDEDRFILIDNDKSFGSDAALFSPKIEIFTNDAPQSFAANVNNVMRIARESKADIYFLNNDLVFTEGWIAPMLDDNSALLSPLSNREVQYESNGFVWKNTLKLPDYLGREKALRELAKNHRAAQHGFKKVISLPFFCIKIPYSIYSVVGEFDESFGRGGAEDDDYCIRAYQAGFEVRYALASYILHFSGKSTWSGAETAQETEDRCSKFREAFTKKWGEEARKLFIDHDMSVLQASPERAQMAQNGDLRGLIESVVRK